MADPHHVEPLDGFDRTTVALYRLGLLGSALSTGALSATLLWAPDLAPLARWGVVLSVALIVADLHLYVRTIRWVISAAGWLGAVLIVGGDAVARALPQAAALGPWLSDAGLGFAFVVLSGVALKERFCFRLPIVVAIPALLALSLVPLRAGHGASAAVLLGLGAATLLVLAGAKLRMPLHYDIGDKRRYEV